MGPGLGTGPVEGAGRTVSSGEGAAGRTSTPGPGGAGGSAFARLGKHESRNPATGALLHPASVRTNSGRMRRMAD